MVTEPVYLYIMYIQQDEFNASLTLTLITRGSCKKVIFFSVVGLLRGGRGVKAGLLRTTKNKGASLELWQFLPDRNWNIRCNIISGPRSNLGNHIGWYLRTRCGKMPWTHQISKRLGSPKTDTKNLSYILVLYLLKLKEIGT